MTRAAAPHLHGTDAPRLVIQSDLMTLDGCSEDDKGKSWCATKVDSKGIMKKDKWARCNEHCRKDDGML